MAMMTIADLAVWLASEWAWTGVDLDDVLLDLRAGTSDAPHLWREDRHYTEASRRMYGGERGAGAMTHWEPGRKGDPLDVSAIARRAAEHIAQCVARNGTTWFTLSAPSIRSQRRETIRIDSVRGDVGAWCAMSRAWEERARYAEAPSFSVEAQS